MIEQIKLDYYDTFICTADKCSLSCCQEWRIAIDEGTYEKWEKVQALDGDCTDLCKHVERDESGYKVKLNTKRTCPLLDENKLCKVVLNLGDSYLSDTCTTFPRVINKLDTCTEYSLDTGCPAVIDLLRDTSVDNVWATPHTSKTTYLHTIRENIIGLLQNTQYSLPERIMCGFYILLELLDTHTVANEQIRQYFEDTQLKTLVTAIRPMRFNVYDTLTESNELFLDIVDNYRKQGLYTAYIEPLAVRAETLESDYTVSALKTKLVAFHQMLGQYESLLVNYLVVEVVGNALFEGSTLEDMIRSFEWLALVYTTVRQMLFIKWLEGGEGALKYDDVRDYMAVLSRVTGYEAQDRQEYLENSFEEALWEWGYLALIVGNKSL